MEEPQFYRRRLPHWQPTTSTFAVTFQLEGALPFEKISALRQAFELRSFSQADWNKYFENVDDLVETNKDSPMWLAEPCIAQEVATTLHYWHEKSYQLIAYCIMPNHVHLIINKIQRPLFRILQSIKRHTARQANLLLNRTHETFWQKESYNHMVRDEVDLKYQLNYLLRNPLKVKLVRSWQDYPFTYVNPEFDAYIEVVHGADSQSA